MTGAILNDSEHEEMQKRIIQVCFIQKRPVVMTRHFFITWRQIPLRKQGDKNV